MIEYEFILTNKKNGRNLCRSTESFYYGLNYRGESKAFVSLDPYDNSGSKILDPEDVVFRMFTGFQDSKLTEIHDGDVVNIDWIDKTFPAFIDLLQGSFWICSKNLPGNGLVELRKVNPKVITVIGNMYDPRFKDIDF